MYGSRDPGGNALPRIQATCSNALPGEGLASVERSLALGDGAGHEPAIASAPTFPEMLTWREFKEGNRRAQGRAGVRLGDDIWQQISRFLSRQRRQA
jgi:hypothetical protein